jgi:uncharacterized protein YyaL (SSP411 family)
MANRLASETSPYLRQHAQNPVDWYPWGDEALSKARSENKPILLSIGYSACHWCHVMEEESFENPAIAALMNENFINIKVDREERPDLDQIYQNVAQLMTRSGGWPLTVFLTPDLRPYFGGTYFPPEDRYGRPGFPRVLSALADAYKNDSANVAENARRLTEAIGQLETARDEGTKRPDAASLRKICDGLVSVIDWHNGGFGGAPKFPSSMGLAYLWRFGCATELGMAQEAVLVSATKMARGGIYDQLGGGFHRYAVDERWAVPHFEKMLYDNGLLLKLYAELVLAHEHGRASVEPADLENFRAVLSETVEWVLREMRSPEGGFYSTQDADSEGEEGKFFVWDPAETRAVLTADEASAACLRYGITDKGNFEQSGKTVLFAAMPVAEVARALGRSPEDTAALLKSARQKLWAARERRPKPARDEKIIASWNGLMISGLAWAARALEATDPAAASRACDASRAALKFVREKMSRDGDRLWSVYKDGQARVNAYLDDYAYLTLAALDLARVVTSEAEAAELTAQALRWLEIVRQRFADRDTGFGYFFTSDDHEKLIHRPKSLFDQAIPSGNSVTLECLLAAAALTGDASLADEADALLVRAFPIVEKAAQGMGEMACATLLATLGPITAAGAGAEAACAEPNIFRKPDSAGIKGVVLCHRNACDSPAADGKAALLAALPKLKLR